MDTTHLMSVILMYHVGVHLASGQVHVDITFIHGHDVFPQS